MPGLLIRGASSVDHSSCKLYRSTCHGLPERHSHLPWPYNGIVNDLRKALANGSNYLAALGMICWSEFIGRQIAKERGDSEGSNFECFTRFVTDCMGYDFGPSAGAVYGAFPDRLVHNYFIKGRTTAVATELHTLPQDHRGTPGSRSISTAGCASSFVREYLRDLDWLGVHT
jgi:hypothetical protein